MQISCPASETQRKQFVTLDLLEVIEDVWLVTPFWHVWYVPDKRVISASSWMWQLRCVDVGGDHVKPDCIDGPDELFNLDGLRCSIS